MTTRQKSRRARQLAVALRNLVVLVLAALSWSCGEPKDGLRGRNAAIDPIGLTGRPEPKLACEGGGRLEFGSVSLTIPPGALSRCTQISVRLADSVDVPENTLYANVDSYTPHPLVFEPHGLRFQAPVLVRITANRRLEPGQLVPVLYKDAEVAPWQGLYLGEDRTPSMGVVLSDGVTVAYVTDHFSQYIQFEAGLTTELLINCGRFDTLRGSVPFACPQFLYGNGWPPELSLSNAGTRENAYRMAIRDVLLAPDIHYGQEAVDKVERIVSLIFSDLGNLSFPLQTASDRLFDLLQKSFPRLLKIEGTNGHGFASVRVRVQGQFGKILGGIDRASLGWLISKQVGKTIFSIWVLNVLDYAGVVSRMDTLKSSLEQSELWKDPALQAALSTVAFEIQQNFDARDQGLLLLVLRAAQLRFDTLGWVSSYSDLGGITTTGIGVALKLGAEANFLLFAAGMIIDWAGKLEEATKGGQYLAALGTLFIHGGLNKEYRNAGLGVLVPSRVATTAERERWNRNLLAETVLYRMAEQAEHAVSLGDVHWTQFALQRLGEALAKLAGAPLDRGAISRKLKNAATAHQKNADAIHAALTADGAVPAGAPAHTGVSPSSAVRGSAFTVSGSGFTPRGTLTLHLGRPDGSQFTAATLGADSSGLFAHTLTTDASTPTGSYSVWAVDSASGRSSSPAGFTVIGLSIAPLVSVSPSRGPGGTLFQQPGSGFSPGGSVTLHFRRPDGTEAPGARYVTDGTGRYSHSFPSVVGTQVGTWDYWAVDDRTGTASPTVSLRITQPTVSVSPASGPRGTVFYEPGSGFTPGGSVTLHFLRPDGTEAPGATHVADSTGSYSHSFPSNTGNITGIWKYWAVDDATSAKSAVVSLTLTP